MKLIRRACPKCGETGVATERRPNGISICPCGYQGPTSEFDTYEVKISESLNIKVNETDAEIKVRNLSMIIRKMVSYAGNREPSIACEKILELYEQIRHALAPSSVLRGDDES